MSHSELRAVLAANARSGLGGQGLNLQQMGDLARSRFEVRVFSRDADEPGANISVPEPRLSRWISSVPVLRRRRDWLGYVSDASFDAYVAAHLDPVDLFQAPTGQCDESLVRARKLGCKTLLDVVTLHVDEFGAVQDRECAKFGIRVATNARARARARREYETAEVIRVMSNPARETFLSRGFDGDKIVVVSPYFAVDEFVQAQFDEPVFRVSFVGLIEPWKGFHYLIDAYSRLALAESELVLWGGPGSRPVSQYLAEKTASDPSIRVAPVEVRTYGYDKVYARSSVLVQPSMADGFGFVVAEAMASGIPVVVTDRTGGADLVTDGVNGYVVPAGDVDAIAARLEHLAAHPALVRTMGAAARDAASQFTFERSSEQYADCLKRLGFATDAGKGRETHVESCQA